MDAAHYAIFLRSLIVLVVVAGGCGVLGICLELTHRKKLGEKLFLGAVCVAMLIACVGVASKELLSPCCPNCGKNVTFAFCQDCGAEPVSRYSKCLECGAMVSRDSDFCHDCGTPMPSN